MRRRGIVVMLLLALPFSTLTAAAAAMEAPPPDVCIPTCPKATGSETGYTVSDKRPLRGVSQTVPGRPAVNGRVADEADWTVVEEEIAPACSINGREGPDALCTAAVSSCPAQDQILYWVWHKTTRYEDGEVKEVIDWSRLPGAYCLGADDPGLSAAPTLSDVIAAVHESFAFVALPEARVEVDPAPRTLVNIKTAFSAGSASPVTLPPVTIFDRQVTITATPREWRWFFGDGASLTTSTPGRAGAPDVAHEYKRARKYLSRVQIVWSGSFTISGSDTVIDIADPVSRTSAPTPVDVREARSELVRD